MSIEQIIAKLDTGAAAKESERLQAMQPFDVLVIGGGPAGASAAAYAARKGIRTGVVTERVGGQVLDTMDIESLVSVLHTEGPKLATALEDSHASIQRRHHGGAACERARACIGCRWPD